MEWIWLYQLQVRSWMYPTSFLLVPWCVLWYKSFLAVFRTVFLGADLPKEWPSQFLRWIEWRHRSIIACTTGICGGRVGWPGERWSHISFWWLVVVGCQVHMLRYAGCLAISTFDKCLPRRTAKKSWKRSILSGEEDDASEESSPDVKQVPVRQAEHFGTLL